MCHKIGYSPIMSIGLGRSAVSSESRLPTPPASIIVIMESLSARASGDCSNPYDSSRTTHGPPRSSGSAEDRMIGPIERIVRNRFVRFLLVGGLNTLFGYSVFALCILIGL